MVISYRTSIAPLIPTLAQQLNEGFAQSRQGCFLWAADSIVREFYDDAEAVQQGYPDAVYQFFEQQAKTFLTALTDLKPEELPDVIEDFFRMAQDVLLYHSARAIPSALIPEIVAAATSTLVILKEEPLMATLHFLRDFLSYGLNDAPYSSFGNGPQTIPAAIQNRVQQVVLVQGQTLTQRLLSGMMFTFPQDCYPDASGVLLGLFQLIPQQTAEWISATLDLVPEGTINPSEKQKLLIGISQYV